MKTSFARVRFIYKGAMLCDNGAWCTSVMHYKTFLISNFWTNMRSKSGKVFDNCQVKNFNFSTFRGNFFARKVEAIVPNFYFSSSSYVEKWMAETGFHGYPFLDGGMKSHFYLSMNHQNDKIICAEHSFLTKTQFSYIIDDCFPLYSTIFYLY